MRMEDVMKAGNRLEVLVKVSEGLMPMSEAASLLKLSKRQCRRLARKAEARGLQGLLNQRSHRAWNRVPEEEVKHILSLRRDLYGSYNLQHFRDVLRENYHIKRSREYYRKLLLSEGLYSKKLKLRIRPRHRKRFESPSAGMLIQRDTSIHLWVPKADKPWRLIVDLDDHSRKITGAFFSEHDDVLSNMLVSMETIETHGIPVAYYTDNNPIFNPLNRKKPLGMYGFYRKREKLKDRKEENGSQFKRALNELGIQMINATPYQPQGKGKIERLFRFMQDRLVNEMASKGVKTIAEANKALRKWVEWYNQSHKHSVTGMIPNERYLKQNSFRTLPEEKKLEEIFCLKYEREVKADNTIQLEGKTYYIPRNEYRVSYARTRVEVRVYFNGDMKIYYQGRVVARTQCKTNKNNQLEDILALH